MKYRPILMGAVLSALMILFTLIVFVNSSSPPSKSAQVAVEANETENLIRSGDTAAAAEKAAQLRSDAQLAAKESRSSGSHGLWLVCAAAVLIIIGCIAYVWISIIRPFHKLGDFADRLASGDLDTPLGYERSNYFGKFTWAFDNMRREIVKARSCEKEAIDNNKTVIAALSHDLKTPLASITAYSEALVNGLYSDTEEMYSFLGIINSKCSEIARLTNDMITHSISELGALKMQPESVDLVELIDKVVRESASKDIVFEKPMFPANVYADPSRLEQLTGNLIGNARKYAGGKLKISITLRNGFFAVSFLDSGGGIPDEDLPFIFDKFYRGSNSGAVSGSGLGLFIVRYIARQSGGEATARNRDGGLEILVELPQEQPAGAPS